MKKRLLLFLAVGLFSLGKASAEQRSIDITVWMFSTSQYNYRFELRVTGDVVDPSTGVFIPTGIGPTPRVYRSDWYGFPNEVEIFGVVGNCTARITGQRVPRPDAEWGYECSFDFHVENWFQHADGVGYIPGVLIPELL